MARTGYADLPLHYGRVPQWLAERMSLLGGAVVEAIILEYGKSEVLKRLSDPLWFQSFGCVLGMDWHSSGITTSVMGALKKAVNPRAKDLGIYICGGRGKHSRQTPNELLAVASKTGLDGELLVRSSKLAAKVDNTSIQDGFQLYLHNFIVTNEGEWSIVQQGLNDSSGMARRYHWHSTQFQSYLNSPHVGVTGENQGLILNLAHQEASTTRDAIVKLGEENPDKMISEIRKIVLPRHHEVMASDVNMKRLGAILTLAHERHLTDFESMLMLEGVGPRAIQSLTLVSEVIYGSPTRFNDPARFSFAHGGKDGHPFPVPLKVYDETINVLKTSIEKAKIGNSEKQKAIKDLSTMAMRLEKNFQPKPFLDDIIQREREESHKHGGMTVFGKAQPPKKDKPQQLNLF
ncbi:DUF763 domain-containing protein [Chryseosolibacter indicus]|uniref:DUF763 domain-containing protein n=1 Tax=Chryseosolibacter indicus TaxID=2782351 RepID=A0ABS5VQF7_9BACT|nr:DUF763 domain-containing protein [Chryseosolibacter indicus]MBT1703085.1 DUF763 domain-containing protein [Chryseosolibacter indicus]